MIKCLYCGTNNNDESIYCAKCGKSLVNSNTSNLKNDNQQNQQQWGENDPRRIDETQYVNNNQQNYGQQGNNDPRRIDETQHVSKNPQPYGQPGNNDPRRIDETQHVSKNPQVNNRQPINNRTPTINNQQQNTNYNTNNQSNGSIFDKISNLSTPVKIIGVILCCCIGIFIISSLMGGVSDQGSLPTTSSNYQTSSNYGGVFDSFSKADCKEIDYKQLNKNPDKYDGNNIKLSGRVMQISEGHSDGNYLLMYVNGDYNQLAYVEYYNDTNIVEGNYITVYGVGAGSYTYSTQGGGSNTVPAVYGAILQ